MLFYDTSVVLFSRDGFQVQWQWHPQDTDPNSVELEVLRSESPNGPFDVLAVVDPRSTFSFFDKKTPNSMLHQEIYYQLRAVDRATGKEVGLSDPFGTNGDLPLDALLIIEQQRILLEGVNGHPPIKGIPGLVTIYRKRNFGRICGDCVDHVTRRIIVSNCRACSGTGKLDGFYDPIDVGMNIQPYMVALKLFNLQKLDDVETAGAMNNFPAMYPGDIVVEPNEKHWRVTRVDLRERHRTIVRQLLYLTQIKPDDVTYKTLRHSRHGGKRF